MGSTWQSRPVLADVSLLGRDADDRVPVLTEDGGTGEGTTVADLEVEQSSTRAASWSPPDMATDGQWTPAPAPDVDLPARGARRAPGTDGFAAEVVATVQEGTAVPRGPVGRVTGFEARFPLYPLEDYYLPGPAPSQTVSGRQSSSEP